MRSHSGKDEARNNMHDPTIRDQVEKQRKEAKRSNVSHASAPADHRGGRKD